MNWKQLLKLKQNKVLGLDIGSSTVKLIQLDKDDNGYTVTAANIADVADGTGENGKGTEAGIIKAIRNCMHADIKTRFAVCGVSGSEVAVRYFKFPSLSDDELEGAVLLEASQVCPFNVDDGAIDYRLISNDGDDACGFLVAAADKLVESKSKLAEGASLSCVLMDVDGLALLNCFNECEKDSNDHATAILNVGSTYTTLAIAGENDLPFVRDITYASKDIINEIADKHKVSTDIVSDTLTGSCDADQPQFEPRNALAEASEKLITDITSTLRYYTAQENSSDVEKIFVCGGFALVEGFVELLDSRLSEKVVLWNPFDKMRCKAGSAYENVLREKGPAMAVAAGLAMRSI